MPKIYQKSPLTVDEQLHLLQERGLLIPDKAIAQHYLSFINYYRLSGYALSFEGATPQGNRDHCFKAGTTFNHLIDLYHLDRLLRLLVMDAIERIEVAVRTQICLKVALSCHNSHWYLDRKLFKPRFDFEKFLLQGEKEYHKSKEEFVCHYKNTYHTPRLPPAWII